MSSSTSTSIYSWTDPSSISPNRTLALFASFTMSMIAFWTRFVMLDKWGYSWTDAPLWVNFMFWPFGILTIILGVPHMRSLVSNWRNTAPWICSILATFGFVWLFQQMPFFRSDSQEAH